MFWRNIVPLFENFRESYFLHVELLDETLFLLVNVIGRKSSIRLFNFPQYDEVEKYPDVKSTVFSSNWFHVILIFVAVDWNRSWPCFGKEAFWPMVTIILRQTTPTSPAGAAASVSQTASDCGTWIRTGVAAGVDPNWVGLWIVEPFAELAMSEYVKVAENTEWWVETEHPTGYVPFATKTGKTKFQFSNTY